MRGASRGINLICISLILSAICMPLSAQVPKDRAWQVLQEGFQSKDAHTRALALRSLGLVSGNAAAEKAAIESLKDKSIEVRISGATALGKIGGKNSIGALKEALQDPEFGVILAAANALRAAGDSSAYLIYYAILTGERKSGGSLVAEQKKMLNDPKKMAQVGFEQGIGFVPFAGLGYGALKAVTKDDVSPIRAAAAVALSADADPKTSEALQTAAHDKSWVVRVAALDAIARRNDSSLIAGITDNLRDVKPEVKYTAAAAIFHLSEVPEAKGN